MKFSRVLTSIVAALCIGTAIAPGTQAHPNFSLEWQPKSWGSAADKGAMDAPSQDESITPSAFKGSARPGSCRLIVWDIGWDQSTDWLGIQGGRENCTNHPQFQVELRKDLGFRPDPTYGRTTSRGNAVVRAYSACQGFGKYYGHVLSSTGNDLRGDNTVAC